MSSQRTTTCCREGRNTLSIGASFGPNDSQIDDSLRRAKFSVGPVIRSSSALLLLAALVVQSAGCSRGADSGQTTDTETANSSDQVATNDTTTTAPKSETKSAGAKAPAEVKTAKSTAAAPPTSEKTKSSQPLPEPVTVAKATEIVDVYRLPRPEKAQVIDDDATSISFQKRGDFDETRSLVWEGLAERGWHEESVDDSQEERTSAVFSRGGYFLFAQVYRPHMRKRHVGILYQLLGNVDVRRLPRMQSTETNFENPHQVGYATAATPQSIMDFYADSLADSGWQAYRDFYDPGPVNAKHHAMHMKNGGVTLLVSLSEMEDSQTMVYCRTELFDRDLPTPASAQDLQLETTPLQILFTSPEGARALADFYEREMTDAGWILHDQQRLDDQYAAQMFVNNVEDPILVEMRPAGEGQTLFRLIPAPQRIVDTWGGSDDEPVIAAGARPFDRPFIMHDEFPMPEDIGISGRDEWDRTMHYQTESDKKANLDFYARELSARGWNGTERSSDWLALEKDGSKLTVEVEKFTDTINRVFVKGNGIFWPGDVAIGLLAMERNADESIAETSGDPSSEEVEALRGQTAADGGRFQDAFVAAEFPLPQDAQEVDRNDSIEVIIYDSPSDQEANLAFFAEKLEPLGWEVSKTRDTEIRFVRGDRDLTFSFFEHATASDLMKVVITGEGLLWPEDGKTVDQTLAESNAEAAEEEYEELDEDELLVLAYLRQLPLPEGAIEVDYDTWSEQVHYKCRADIATIGRMYQEKLSADEWIETTEYTTLDSDRLGFVRFEREPTSLDVRMDRESGMTSVEIGFFRLDDLLETLDIEPAEQPRRPARPLEADVAGDPGEADWDDASDAEESEYVDAEEMEKIVLENLKAIPLPKDAQDVEYEAMFEELKFKSPSSIKEITAHYQKEMPGDKWREDMNFTFVEHEMGVLQFKKGGAFMHVHVMHDEGISDVTVRLQGMETLAADGSPQLDDGPIEVEMLDEYPVPANNTGSYSEGTNFLKQVHATAAIALARLVEFYREQLAELDWEAAGESIEEEKAELRFTGEGGELILTLAWDVDETKIEIAIRDHEAAKEAGIAPPKGGVLAMIGNMSEAAATIKLDGKQIRLKAGEGSEDPADAKRVELKPGKHTVEWQMPGEEAESETFEVSADQTWGVIVLPGGVMPMRLY